MTIPVEAYCSDETRKLLAKAGLNTYERDFHEMPGGYISYSLMSDGNIPLAIALSWLREEKHIFVDFRYGNRGEAVSYYVYDYRHGKSDVYSECSQLSFNKQEEAEESAIKYILEKIL